MMGYVPNILSSIPDDLKHSVKERQNRLKVKTVKDILEKWEAESIGFQNLIIAIRKNTKFAEDERKYGYLVANALESKGYRLAGEDINYSSQFVVAFDDGTYCFYRMDLIDFETSEHLILNLEDLLPKQKQVSRKETARRGFILGYSSSALFIAAAILIYQYFFG